MNNTQQSVDLARVITARRTVKPERMNGKVIPEEVIVDILTMADWAPTHARTEPWRFVVIAPDKVKEFTTRHADLLKETADPATFTADRYNKIAQLGDNTSHVIIAWMKRVPNHKIPEVEEIAAASAAIQNLLLAATAHGVVAFWSSSGLTHHPALKQEYKMGEEDIILGIIYLGYTDEPLKPGQRNIPLSEKIEWVR